MTITSYATAADMLVRYDARLIGDLVSDNGTQANPADLLTNAVLTTTLTDAYSQIVATIVVGNRYTLDQIDPTKMNPTAVAILKRLNCEICLIMLKQRRGTFSAEKDKALYDKAMTTLKQLQDGASMLLGILDANAQASTLELADPTMIPVSQRNTIRFRTRNYYPSYPYNGSQSPATNGN